MFRIIALSDFSASAHQALRFAMRLAQTYSGEVILLHGMEQPPVPATAPAEVFSGLLQAARGKHLERLREQMQRAFGELGIRHGEVLYRLEVAPTPLAETVMERAERAGAALVVMGSPASGGLTRALLGSTSRQLVDRATRPLLLVPQEAVFRGFANISLVIRPRQFTAGYDTGLLARLVRTYSSRLHFIFVEEDGDAEVELEAFLTKNSLLGEVTEYAWRAFATASSRSAAELPQQLETSSADLVVLFPREKSLWEELFSSSPEDEAALQGNIPLLLLPAGSS